MKCKNLATTAWMLPFFIKKENPSWGLPWWFSGKESAYQCRRHGFDPWSGKILYAMEQLSLCATTTEPLLQNLWAASLSPCAATTEAHVPRAQALQQQKPLHERPTHHNSTTPSRSIKTQCIHKQINNLWNQKAVVLQDQQNWQVWPRKKKARWET